ncbi:MAG TPA: HAMP domain-containing sensor histidine kinase [Bacteriovoracaceae bacterium]|nr:HAMP domain-containing sensor histidine kinase [Bacteriovoracaceae bacterium]
MKAGKKALANINRIDEMIRDLLDATKIKAGKGLPIERENCDLSAIVNHAVQDLSSIHGSRFIMSLQEGIKGHWSCTGVRRIIENLCSNAIKYGNPDTPVSVTTETVNDQAMVYVHNQGPVIPLEKQALLFDPFMQAYGEDSTVKKGWGLGLTLVKGLAEAHGGTVEIQSHVDHGTTFKICLPLGY